MSGSHIEMDPARDMIEATREAMEGMIVPPTHFIVSDRVAAILVGHPAVARILRGDPAPEPVIHIDTPRPLGKRARRRAKARAR